MVELFCVLATWRITHLIMAEAGPYDLMYIVRSPFLEGGDPEGRPINWIGEMLKCFYCTSMWFAVPFALYLARWNWLTFPIYLLGLSGSAILVNVIIERFKDDRI